MAYPEISSLPGQSRKDGKRSKRVAKKIGEKAVIERQRYTQRYTWRQKQRKRKILSLSWVSWGTPCP